MSELEFTPTEKELADKLLNQVRQTEPAYELTLGDRVYIKAIAAGKVPVRRYIWDGEKYSVLFDALFRQERQ